ncbi:MAG: lamin tail domain-containing protein, partial [Caldilineaceae bacterium]|nr:lamin tail domain-containing protein [Caldilineaceae bacterium]
GDTAVNLRGWILADLGTDEHVIGADVIIAPGAYVVMGRNADRALNGGVTFAYVYSGVSLANTEDEVLLLAPNREEADRVVWGDDLRVSTGASLERVRLEPATWQTAATSWPGSAGDLGSPGAASGPAGGDEPAPVDPPSPGATPTPDGELPANDGPRTLMLSEFLANPDTVGDSEGEWIELFNWGDAPVNLRGWTLADLGTDRFTVATDLTIAPGAYIVLARNGDAAANGGVDPALTYTGISLANGEDELLLIAPDGVEIDRVVWGEALTARAGVSLERAGTTPAAPWQEARGPWRAGGDWGTPNAAPGTNPPGDDQPPGPLVPTPVADVNVPAKWTWAADAAPVVIDEVAFRGSDQEFVVLRNLTEQEIDLGGWLVGDAATPGSGEGMYVLPDGLTIAPAGRVILARNAAGFVADYVLRPDAEFEESAAEVPSLSRRRDLATGQFALKDGGDEVLLLTPAGQLVDAVAYGTGDGVALGLTGTLDASGGDSLQRVDGVPPQADQRHRFAYAPP